jgi:hypothetical protein
MADKDGEIWCDRPAWRGARLSLELFGIIAGVIGVVLVVAEIFTMNRLNRVEQSFRFVERYSDDAMLAHRMRVASVAEEINAGLRALGDDVGLNDSQKVQVLDAYFLTDTPEARENLRSLIRIVRFFEEVAICEEVGMCHTDVVCQFFTSHAAQYREDFAHVYETHAQRNALGDIGAGLAHLASEEEMKCPDLFADN